MTIRTSLAADLTTNDTKRSLAMNILNSGGRSIMIRPARGEDQRVIQALVRSEPLNPTRLNWPNFVVAAEESGLVGAVQLRTHSDGSREIGSLIVRKEWRGQGIASRMIDALISRDDGRLLVITNENIAALFERRGFRRIEPDAVPAAIRRNYRIGRLAGIISLLKFRRMRRLVILDRGVAARPRDPRVVRESRVFPRRASQASAAHRSW
jgi:N-acetylglutamate synthase-like GNAT family acetyltransferase